MRKLLAVVLLSLAACSSDVSQVADPTEGSTARWREQPVEWFLRSISDDGRTIAIVYNMSGVASECEREGGAEAEERRDRVVVSAHKDVITDRARACTEELAFVDDEVKLEAPLGERALVGCKPGKTGPEEDDVCRDLERSRERGIFEFSPRPSG